MTQRDWQKDFDFCRHADKIPLTPGNVREAMFALTYWLQEAKELQEIVSGRGRELLRHRDLLKGLNDELTATEARADAAENAMGLMEGERDQYKMWQQDEEKRANDAEDREQRLKELMKDALGSMVMIAGKDNDHVQRIVKVFRTLYPDTPAPTKEVSE